MTDDLMCHEVATLESQNVGVLGWCPNLMEEMLDIMFHYGGDFKEDQEGTMVYYPDNKACLGDLDVDTLDVFYLRNYHKKLGYDEIKQCWWQVPGKGLENGLRSLNNDKEIREMVKCAKINNGVIDVYFEHRASLPKVLEGNTQQKKNSPRLTQPLPPNTKVASNTKGTQSPSTVSYNQNQTKKSINKVSRVKPNKPTGSIRPTKPIKTTQNTKTDKTNKSKQPKKNSISRRPCTRSTARGFQSLVFNNEIPFEVPSDSYESAEDSLFKPNLDEDSSSNSDTGVKNVNNGSRSRVNKNKNEKILRNVGPLAKEKEKILVEDDAFVQEVSDEEVDLGFIGNFAEGVEYGLDPGADSDGANSWHS
ncbi:hypothetical protein Ahy_B06g081359 [Arachis hypogaea]|uniref:PB1-like domain-containing protein n=1 Tax=Arachis hypogaea TaxID=3818 RepID=A0A444YKR8_ARAHY|nr:hypothetical protein Ahy_B06g081359 [Arachis hypogaea]